MKKINKSLIVISIFALVTCKIVWAEGQQIGLIKTVNDKNVANVGIYNVTGEMQNLHFRIVINDNSKKIKDSVYIEHIPKGISVDNNSLTVEKYLGENKYEDVTANINKEVSDNQIKIGFNDIKDKYVIKYDAKIVDLGKKSFDSLGSFFYKTEKGIKSMDEVAVKINVIG